MWFLGFPGGSAGKESICNAGDVDLVPGSGKSLRAENGKPLQYASLENSMGRGAWQAPVHGVAMPDTHTHTHTHIPTDMVHIFLWIELSRGFLLLNDPFSPFQMWGYWRWNHFYFLNSFIKIFFFTEVFDYEGLPRCASLGVQQSDSVVPLPAYPSIHPSL